MYPSCLRTWAMATLTLDAGVATTARSVICALRMRVNISAMGSVMLMGHSLLPARLDDARDLPAHTVFPQLVAAEAEFAEDTAWTTGDRATIAQPRRIRIAGQRLQLESRGEAVLFRNALVVDDRFQRS